MNAGVRLLLATFLFLAGKQSFWFPLISNPIEMKIGKAGEHSFVVIGGGLPDCFFLAFFLTGGFAIIIDPSTHQVFTQIPLR
jgi:hypothetical protein